MRGGDERTGELFSYVNLEKRVRLDHPLRAIKKELCERGAGRAGAGVRQLYAPIERPVDTAGEAGASDAVASVLFNSLGTAIDGAAGTRFAVSLVRWHRRRRRGVGSLSFFQEPRAPVGRRHRSQAVRRSSCASASEAASQHRPFLGRRHADRSLGVDEEFQAEAWLGRTARGWRRTQLGGGFSRREALERHPRLDYRSRGEALSQRARQGGQALLHGACPGGEPQRPGGRRLFDTSRWTRRARRSAAHDRATRRSAAGDHAGCR